MKIVSWNINGIKAAINKGFLDWLATAKPDVVCLQETKAAPENIPAEARNIPGYETFWHPCERKKGYSGVAVLTRVKPDNVNMKIGVEDIDNEGRILEVDYGAFTLYGVYFPNGSKDHIRVPYKLEFYDKLFSRCAAQREAGKKIVVCGDYNTAHKPIDLARPKENQNTTGFLQIERDKLDELASDGWLDTFREFHPDEADQYSYWDQITRARERNVGWRIDYHWITADLRPSLKNAYISQEVMGSDHCPVGIILNP